MRIGVAVIDALEHDIFKSDPLRIAGFWVVAQSIKQYFYVPALVDGNQLVADRICCGMKGDGQQAANFRCCSGNLWHDAGCRQGDAPPRQLNALRVHCYFHRIPDIFKIIQRLSHAHQHDVRQKPCGGGRIAPRCGPFA